MLERFGGDSRFQGFAPGIGLFLVLLGTLITAAGVTWMLGGEAAAQPGPSSFTVTKTDGSQVGQEVVWTVVVTNNSDSSEAVEFRDDYGGQAGTDITDVGYSGDQLGVSCLVLVPPFDTLSCFPFLWAHSTALFTIRTSLPPATCDDITLTNAARLFAIEQPLTIGESLVVELLLAEDLDNSFILPGDPGECPETPTPETPSPSPTVCNKCNTPPPTFPPGLVSTPVPTNTPVPPPPPVATQSGGLTDEQRTQTAVAGAKTAAALITPLPPRTGGGSQTGAQNGALNISLALGGLVILAIGLGVLGTRSRRER